MSDMYAKPLTTGGTMPFSSFGWTPLTPMIMWVDGLVKSKSKRPTLLPRRANVKASVVATRLLPTPPFPLETAIILFIRLNRSFITLVRGSIGFIALLLCFQARLLVLLRFQSLGYRILDT